jgi:Fur family ferric uptake transcriptional regulator
MPDAPRSERLDFDGIDDIAEATRRAGGRFSAARRAVLEALFAAEGPISAEHVARSLAQDGNELELSSVYRSLEHLERLGAVRHVHIGHGPGLYALTGDGEREYLACERCGRVEAVHAEELDPVRELIRELSGYEARFTHFPIIGLCRSCAATGGSEHGHRHDDASGHAHQH